MSCYNLRLTYIMGHLNKCKHQITRSNSSDILPTCVYTIILVEVHIDTSNDYSTNNLTLN